MGLACRNSTMRRSDATLIGAYVRLPEAGLHGYVIDLDFTSLYPSIICSCNIGPNTYYAKITQQLANNIIYHRNRLIMDEDELITFNPLYGNSIPTKMKIKDIVQMIDEKKLIITTAGTIYINHKDEVSFFNRILTYLLSSRKKYKNEMKKAKNEKNDDDFKRYKNMQLAYKILANSIYGVLGNYAFRFFNHDLAESVTMTGQDIVKFSGYHVGQYLKTGKRNVDVNFLVEYDTRKIPYVIYQDTDSIFIDLGRFLIDRKVITL